MKKIITLLFLFMGCTFIFMLTACNDSENIRYTVTKEEWEALMIEDNYTFEVEVLIDGEYDKYDSKYTESAIQIDDLIVVFIEDKQYSLSETETGWEAHDATVLDFWHGGLLEDNSFDDYKYDEEKKVYVSKIDEELNVWTEIEFNNGIPVKMVDYGIMDGENSTEFILYSRIVKNIGSTVIDIPEYTFYEPEEIRMTVTEEEWNMHLNAFNFEALFFPAVDGEGLSSTQYSMNGVHLLDDEYYVEENGKIYHLVETESGWIGEEIEAFLGLSGPLIKGLDYNDFVYNSETMYYETDKVTEEGLKYSFMFGDGYLALISIENTLDSNSEIEYYFIGNVGSVEFEVPEYTIKK